MPTDTWTSSQLFTANWTTAGDWSGGLPTTTSDVTIAQGGPIVTSAISIASLTFSTGGVEFESAGASSVSGSVTVSGNGILSFDKDAGTGGSSLTIGGALTLSGSFTSFDIGANTQSTGDTVTAASLSVGTGAGLGIQNETGSNETDTLDITGQAGFGTAGILTGNILIANGNGASSSVIEFGSGSITTIAANGKLTLEGPKAFIADASNLSANSALTQLATINGILDLTAISSLSLGNALTNTGSISVEDVQSVGGTSLNISGVLTNSGQITLGTSAGLSFADTITATGLTNSVGNTLGTISIGGGGGSSATLDITSQAGFGTTGVLTGTVSLSTYQSGGVYNGAAILEFSSGEITTIAANSSLSINTGNAFLADATNLSANSALTGLAANNGTVNLSNIAPLTLTGALSNTGLFNLDIATLNVSGALTNSGGHISIGATTGSGATTMAATALNNTSSGIILLSGNSNSLGQLSINGAAVNNGTVTIGTNSIIAVTGNSYTQAGGTTTINGTLTASAIDISGGTLELGSTGSLSTGVAFTGGTGTLQLDLKTNQPSSIAGATAGDTIDLRFQSFAAGDHAVWQQSGGTGALTLETSGGATLDTLTLSGQYTSANFSVATDNSNGKQIQLVNLAPPPPPPPPPAATADMVMRNGNNGNYEIYDLGGNSIVAASAIGQVGLEWQVAGLGSFFGADTSDMLLRNSNSGTVRSLRHQQQRHHQCRPDGSGRPGVAPSPASAISARAAAKPTC